MNVLELLLTHRNVLQKHFLLETCHFCSFLVLLRGQTKLYWREHCIGACTALQGSFQSNIPVGHSETDGVYKPRRP